MVVHFLVLAVLLGLAIPSLAENKGTCPAAPSPPKLATKKTAQPQPAPSPDEQYAGTVTTMIVVSETGYLCSAQVVSGAEGEMNKAALSSIREWHLKPYQKNGRPVPTVLLVRVDFWRKSDGELVQSSPTSTDLQHSSEQRK